MNVCITLFPDTHTFVSRIEHKCQTATRIECSTTSITLSAAFFRRFRLVHLSYLDSTPCVSECQTVRAMDTVRVADPSRVLSVHRFASAFRSAAWMSTDIALPCGPNWFANVALEVAAFESPDPSCDRIVHNSSTTADELPINLKLVVANPPTGMGWFRRQSMPNPWKKRKMSKQRRRKTRPRAPQCQVSIPALVLLLAAQNPTEEMHSPHRYPGETRNSLLCTGHMHKTYRIDRRTLAWRHAFAWRHVCSR